MKQIQRQPQETLNEYILRLCKYKEIYGLSWRKISTILSTEYNYTHDESFYRKKYTGVIIHPVATTSDMCQERLTEQQATFKAQIDQALLDLRKERVKVRDEVAQNGAYIRTMAREESLKEIALECAKAINHTLLPEVPPLIVDKPTPDRTGILQISDWHYGIEINNIINQYSPEIAVQRIKSLEQQTIALCKENHIKTLYIADLGDLICGRIHLPLRIKSRFDIITQEIQISQILSEFLVNLSKECIIHYYSCIDNHSRIEPNKKESLQLETVARIHPWFLKERLKNYTNIHIHDNEKGPDLIEFSIYNWKYKGVHGDKDKPAGVVNSITQLTKEFFNVVLTAHLHHFAADEKTQCVVISNSSVMGVDDLAYDLRLTSVPSQNLIVVTPDNPAKYIARILV